MTATEHFRRRQEPLPDAYQPQKASTVMPDYDPAPILNLFPYGKYIVLSGRE
jgi:hypothetical protein